MNLRGIANRATSLVNRNVNASLRAYAGVQTAASGKRSPTYAEPVPIVLQVQALSKKEVEHLDALNISNATRAAYANGQLRATDRRDGTGGDLLVFEDAQWLVVAVLEGWTTAGWCKVALVKQLDAVS